MSVKQSPVFFVASLHRRWVFGEFSCELYGFCGALFGIASMMTLTAIVVDGCLAITRPLALLGGVSRQRLTAVVLGVWAYSLGWSLPPFFGWSAFIPEGLLTSCSWDYMSFTAAVRAYTILLFLFIFFVSLGVIIVCYLAIFRAVRKAAQDVKKLSCGETQQGVRAPVQRMAEGQSGPGRDSAVHRLLVAFTAHLLTPYMNSVPAVIAKASAIHNPHLPHHTPKVPRCHCFIHLCVLSPLHPQHATRSLGGTRSPRQWTLEKKPSVFCVLQRLLLDGERSRMLQC